MSDCPGCPTCNLHDAINEAIAAYSAAMDERCLAACVNEITGVLVDQMAATILTGCERAVSPAAAFQRAQDRMPDVLRGALLLKASRHAPHLLTASTGLAALRPEGRA